MAIELSLEIIGIIVGLVVLSVVLSNLYGVAGNYACPTGTTGLPKALADACNFVTSFGSVIVTIAVILLLVAVIYVKTRGGSLGGGA